MLREKLAGLFGQESLAMVIAGNSISVLVGALIWIILAGMLPVEDYGRANYVLSLGAFLATLPILGFNVTFRAYLPRGREELVAPAVLLTSAISLILGVPFLSVHPALPLIVFSNSVFILLTSERLGHLKYRDFFILQAVTRILQLILIPIIVPHLGFEGAVYSITLPFTAFSLSMLRKVKGGLRGVREVVKYFRFSLLSYLSGIVAALGTRFDKIMIGTLYGERALGHYQLAFQFYSALQAIPTSLSSYLLPIRSAGKPAKLQEALGLVLSFMTSILGFFLIPDVVKLMFPAFYPESARAGSLVSLAIIFDSIYGISSARRLSEEDPATVLISSLISLPLLFTSIYFLGSGMGVEGLALSLLIYRASACLSIASLSLLKLRSSGEPMLTFDEEFH